MQGKDGVKRDPTYMWKDTHEESFTLVLLDPGQVQNKLKFVDSLQIMTSTSSYTHQNWFEDLKWQFAPYGGNNLFIPLTSFHCHLFSYVLMKHWTLLNHTPRNTKNQWGKGTLFNVHNTYITIFIYSRIKRQKFIKLQNKI